MIETQTERIKEIDKIRDALLAGCNVLKRQDIGGCTFIVRVKLEILSGDAAKDKEAAEAMAEYLFYGGMAC